jgi:hypothetical protein
MDLRIPEQTHRYQWPGQTLPDPRYQWHGPTNPAVVEARRAQARASQLSARVATAEARKPPPPKTHRQTPNKFEQPPFTPFQSQ